MNSYVLPILLILTVGSIGCSPAKPEPITVEIDIEAALASAARAEHAILFVQVDWSLTAIQPELFSRFVTEYNRNHAASPAEFHYLDCTAISAHYNPLRDLPGWHELEEKARVGLIHGNGEVIWMSRGKVVHVEPIIHYKGPTDLVRKSDALSAMRE